MPLIITMRHAVPSPRTLSPTTRWSRWGLVLAFTLTTLGLPLDDWFTVGSSASATPCTVNLGSACQCSPARRWAGRCCCQLKPKAIASTVGCCASRQKSKASESRTSSCCKTQQTAPKTIQNTGLSITSCGCGSGEPQGFLWSGDPRIMNAPVVISAVNEARDSSVPKNETATGARTRPDVPPPRDRLLSV